LAVKTSWMYATVRAVVINPSAAVLTKGEWKQKEKQKERKQKGRGSKEERKQRREEAKKRGSKEERKQRRVEAPGVEDPHRRERDCATSKNAAYIEIVPKQMKRNGDHN